MTVIPDDSWLCFCWAFASNERRAEIKAMPRNHGPFSPRGDPDCPWCKGAGWGRSKDWRPEIREAALAASQATLPEK